MPWQAGGCDAGAREAAPNYKRKTEESWMKYLQSGGFQSHPLMRLTLALAAMLLAGFWLTNFGLYFAKMGLTPASVASYYLGAEEEFRMPRTYQSMLEVTHMHLPMMAMVVLLLTHLLIFSPFSPGLKRGFIIAAFTAALGNEAAGWLVRFVDPAFSWLKLVSFLSLQALLAFLLGSLIWFLWRARRGEESAGAAAKARSPRQPAREQR